MPTYSPSWAPHVVGTYPERVVDPETGEHEPQVVKLACSVCGEGWKVTCHTGAVRQHVLQYALVHAHRDALKVPVPPKRG